MDVWAHTALAQAHAFWLCGWPGSQHPARQVLKPAAAEAMAAKDPAQRPAQE